MSLVKARLTHPFPIRNLFGLFSYPKTAETSVRFNEEFELDTTVLPGNSAIQTYPLPGTVGSSFISYWAGPGHESSSPGTPYLSVALFPHAEKKQAYFNFGNGWIDRFCDQPHAIYVTPPNTPHEWKIDGSLMVVMLSISMQQISAVMEELEVTHDALALLKPLAEKGYPDPMVHHLILRLWTYVRAGTPCNPLFLQSSLVCILHSIASKITQKAGVPAPQLSDSVLKNLLDMIEDRISENLSLTDLANFSKTSKFHFIRLFSEATGRTPYQYIQHRRIERARLMLLTSRMSVADIGALVGFGDAPNFSRTFSKHVGVSPSQYRIQSSDITV